MSSADAYLERGECLYYELTRAGKRKRILDGTYSWNPINKKLVSSSLTGQEIDEAFGIAPLEEGHEIIIGQYTVIITSTFLQDAILPTTCSAASPRIPQTVPRYRVSTQTARRFPHLPRMIERQAQASAATSEQARQETGRLKRLMELSNSADNTRAELGCLKAKLAGLKEVENYEDLAFQDLLDDEDLADCMTLNEGSNDDKRGTSYNTNRAADNNDHVLEQLNCKAM